MLNPWLSLRDTPPYVLDVDADEIEAYCRKQTKNSALALDSIPEPWIGNPQSATVVLLLLNPGHSPRDSTAHSDPRFKQALFSNLRREPQDYPFYPLNPSFSSTPSALWWRKRLAKLICETSLTPETLSKKLLAIEWFPYHSRNSGLPARRICKSQDYSFELAREALANRLVVRMRSARHRAIAVKEFEPIPELKNPRSAYVSPGNMDPDLFESVLKALQEV